MNAINKINDILASDGFDTATDNTGQKWIVPPLDQPGRAA